MGSSFESKTGCISLLPKATLLEVVPVAITHHAMTRQSVRPSLFSPFAELVMRYIIIGADFPLLSYFAPIVRTPHDQLLHSLSLSPAAKEQSIYQTVGGTKHEMGILGSHSGYYELVER